MCAKEKRAQCGAHLEHLLLQRRLRLLLLLRPRVDDMHRLRPLLLCVPVLGHVLDLNFKDLALALLEHVAAD